MKRTQSFCIVSSILIAGCSMHGTNTETPTTPEPIAQVAPTDDPYLWLEEVEGAKALSWVEEQNKESLALFESDTRYGDFLGAAETILNATDRIPYGTVRNGQVYNFWQDKKNHQ